jgi:ring-1,2-phenylacetyl-CoA epoxidase subunit PaaC
VTGHQEGAPPLVARYALALGDDALVLAQRLVGWVTRAPELEEEVALANIALDLLGQARTLLAYAGSFDGRSEDDLAFGRTEREFTHLQITERPNGDFAATIARQLFFAAYQHALYGRLCASVDPTLAGVAGKAVKEVAYHRDHAAQWTLRLGDGTALSHDRMQAGLAEMWPWTAEMFAPDDVTTALAGTGVAIDPADLRADWEAFVLPVLAEATLTVPQVRAARGGGRQGVHTEPFSALLAEMAHLHLSYPGAQW